jgi:proline iminopeptidase
MSLPCLLSGILAVCASSGPMQSTAEPLRRGMIHADEGIELFFRLEGDGADEIVVLHGGPGLSSESLRPDLGFLARHFTLIFYDQRGSGLSTPINDPARVSIAHHVADIEVIRARFGLDRVTLMGHSWGGGLALHYAIRHPKQTGRIILIDPMPLRRDPHIAVFGRNLREWMDNTTLAKLNQAAIAWDKAPDPHSACNAYWELFIRGYLADPHGRIPVQGNPCHGSKETLNDRMYRYTLGSLGAWDWREEARSIQVPVLIVHGEKSPLPLESFREWEAALPNGKLVMVPDSGHYPHAEQPERFLSIVRPFIREESA